MRMRTLTIQSFEAMKFSPGRENADRMLNFVAELREIRKCHSSNRNQSIPKLRKAIRCHRWTLFLSRYGSFSLVERKRERERERARYREREGEGGMEGGREGEGEREGQREPHAAADIHGSFLDLVKDLRLAQEEFRFLSVYEVQM